MASILVDTNLLVLLVVGLTSEPMIKKHRRTREYDRDDFLLLTRELERFTDLVVTAHVLAETSNLIRYCSEPLRTRVGQCLADLIGQSREHGLQADDVVQQADYLRVGLTDAGILQAQEDGATLLTDDHDLYIASLRSGYQAINFSHLRDDALS